jgi:NADPH:quinone reductase-like Zn-dependent oxidoreductase
VRSRPVSEVYCVTHARFAGAYTRYALVEAHHLARKPDELKVVEAA